MSGQATTSGTLVPNKPVTRSSLRQTLALSSVGKAFADVMHKDGKDNTSDKEKVSKKTKDVASRRTSAIGVSQMPVRSSIDKSQLNKEDDVAADVKNKEVARHARRTSAVKKTPITDSDDTSSSPTVPRKVTVTRASSLRPRTSNGPSALPKYRPRSMLLDTGTAKKAPSPTHVGSKSRLVNSSDEKESDSDDKRSTLLGSPSSAKKLGPSISPVPHKSALKVNLTKAINVHPQTPEKKSKLSANKRSPPPSPSPRHGTSARPTKTPKTSSHESAPRSTIPRPPSSASSSTSSQTPRTPKTGVFKKVSGTASQRNSPSPSPLRKGTAPDAPESPLSELSARKQRAQLSSPNSDISRQSTTPTPGVFTEGFSNDSIDVEFLLSSVASPSAPTPALPRFRLMGDQDAAEPHTPSRSVLPSRSNLSYLSPDPPSSTNSSPFLRPLRRQFGNDRGSILSWDQLAKHSKTLQEDDVRDMLSEIPAPFRSGAVSPSLSTSTTHEVPESPTLSALPSPTGYGSISQILLPDVTPSPAPHSHLAKFDNIASDPSLEDAASVTLLRLQLASADTKARDRLAEIESLEAQLQTAKAARLRDTEELAKQISHLEEQVHSNLDVDNERMEYITSLEEQLRRAQTVREEAVQQTLQQTQERAQAAQVAALAKHQQKWEAACLGGAAEQAWDTVRDVAEGELELVRANRDTLAVLLAGLDHSRRQLLAARA